MCSLCMILTFTTEVSEGLHYIDIQHMAIKKSEQLLIGPSLKVKKKVYYIFEDIILDF